MKRIIDIDPYSLEAMEIRAKLQGSLILYMQTFFPLVNNGREFIISNPPGRESHFITVSRELTCCARLETLNLILNLPPGHAKSTMLSLWVTQQLSIWPDSNFLYISYSQSLAATHTGMIRSIMQLPEYHQLFGVTLRKDSKAKEEFRTEHGGCVAAFGAGGAITGRNGGLPGLPRFSGAIIIDDAHKPDEVNSQTQRQAVIENYKATIKTRKRGEKVPIIFLGQRLHEDDLPAYLLSGEEGSDWRSVVLKSIDDAGNPLYPEAFPLEELRLLEKHQPYVFASQHQQNPLPAGGGLYKKDDFRILDEEPEILATFITADTAETDKEYNDFTVFSFFGIYKIAIEGLKTEILGLHWIDCWAQHIDASEINDAFMDFWTQCARHKMPPMLAAIEKKSTGVTLVSTMKKIPGMQIRAIERNRSSGSKTTRFIQAQAQIGAKLVSFTKDAKHLEMCIDHMTKITANESHRWDDIADTCADGIKIALVDKAIYIENTASNNANHVMSNVAKNILRQNTLRNNRYDSRF